MILETVITLMKRAQHLNIEVGVCTFIAVKNDGQ